MSKNPIDTLIEAKEAHIARAERTIDKLKIEIAVLREAREAVAGTVEQILSDATPTQIMGEGRRGRSLSAPWKLVLRSIADTKRGGADLDQIFSFCRYHGIDLKRPTLRAQMSNYVKSGYLGRTGEGRFFTTVGGLEVIGMIPANTGNEAGASALTDAPE